MDIQLRNKKVVKNIRLVREVVKRFDDRSDYADLFQVGCLALIRCVERYDESRDNTFSSYAVACIRGAVFNYLRDKNSLVKIPRKYGDLVAQAKKFPRLNESEVAAKLGVSLDEWRDAKRSIEKVRSLDVEIYEGSDITHLDILASDNDLYDDVLDDERSRYVESLLSSLSVINHRIALELIYFGELTQKEVAERMGVSAVSVRRYKKQAIEALRKV